MSINVNLISMPWAYPFSASIQIGVLKAHLDSIFKGEVMVHSHSLYLPASLDGLGENLYYDYVGFEEYSFLFLCLQNLKRHSRSNLKNVKFEDELEALNNARYCEKKLTKSALSKIEDRTIDAIETHLVPNLSLQSLNVVGFTLNYYQVYSSIFCYQYLKEKYPEYQILYVFGGTSMYDRGSVDVLKAFGVDGLGIIGEGEVKLEAIVKKCIEDKKPCESTLVEKFKNISEGIFSIQTNSINFEERQVGYFDLQLKKLSEVPTPDYTEYFKTFNKTFKNKQNRHGVRDSLSVLLEGSRGCFARCDFCNLNSAWDGFRKMDATSIFMRTMSVISEHGINHINYVDSVCDTWAESFSEMIIDQGITVEGTYELRAHHPEKFWTKLALSGAKVIQIGVEALSSSLLKKMNKGTNVRQNVLVQKWLKELGVRSGSNLITHHPKSSLKDVRETMDRLMQIGHLDRFQLVEFVLPVGSPLYNELSIDEKLELEGIQFVSFSNDLKPYLVPYWGMISPAKWHDKKVAEEWNKLVAWYHSIEDRGDSCSMTVQKIGNDLMQISDSRSGKEVSFILKGIECDVYEVCHSGPRVERIVSELKLDHIIVLKTLHTLLQKGLLIEIEGSYISLALRPRDELIENLFKANGEKTDRLKLVDESVGGEL